MEFDRLPSRHLLVRSKDDKLKVTLNKYYYIVTNVLQYNIILIRQELASEFIFYPLLCIYMAL